jgi:hypothetical protein
MSHRPLTITSSLKITAAYWAALSSPGSGIILTSQQKLPELLAKHSNDGKSQLSSTATFVQ